MRARNNFDYPTESDSNQWHHVFNVRTWDLDIQERSALVRKSVRQMLKEHDSDLTSIYATAYKQFANCSDVSRSRAQVMARSAVIRAIEKSPFGETIMQIVEYGYAIPQVRSVQYMHQVIREIATQVQEEFLDELKQEKRSDES